MKGKRTNVGQKMHRLTVRLTDQEMRYCLYCRSFPDKQTAQDGLKIILHEHHFEHLVPKGQRKRV